jgi:hypothetical protein
MHGPVYRPSSGGDTSAEEYTARHWTAKKIAAAIVHFRFIIMSLKTFDANKASSPLDGRDECSGLGNTITD